MYLKIVAHIPAKQPAPMLPHHTYKNSEFDPKENTHIHTHTLRK